ncbi:TPA: bacteriocin [Streptococcus pneumoniae]
MNTKMMSQFSVMDNEMLDRIEGGIFGVDDALFWAGLGTAICAASGVGAPFMGACGYIGAKFGVALWTGVTGATGGF